MTIVLSGLYRLWKNQVRESKTSSETEREENANPTSSKKLAGFCFVLLAVLMFSGEPTSFSSSSKHVALL